MLYFLDRKDAKKRDLLLVVSEVLVWQVLEQIGREIVVFNGYLGEYYVGFVAWRRVVDHVAEGIWIVEGGIDALVIVVCAESERKSSSRG